MAGFSVRVFRTRDVCGTSLEYQLQRSRQSWTLCELGHQCKLIWVEWLMVKLKLSEAHNLQLIV
jgi:hypothetical protein